MTIYSARHTDVNKYRILIIGGKNNGQYLDCNGKYVADYGFNVFNSMRWAVRVIKRLEPNAVKVTKTNVHPAYDYLANCHNDFQKNYVTP